MKKLLLKCGIPLMLTGVAMLAVGFPTHLVDHNSYLIATLIIVIAGLFLHVRKTKNDSRY